MEIEVRLQDKSIKVYINGIIHLLIRQDELMGFQSYIESHRSDPYVIEFTLRDKVIISDYEDKVLWEKILKGLDEAFIFRPQGYKSIGYISEG